jgi:uncharacterized membrane protein
MALKDEMRFMFHAPTIHEQRRLICMAITLLLVQIAVIILHTLGFYPVLMVLIYILLCGVSVMFTYCIARYNYLDDYDYCWALNCNNRNMSKLRKIFYVFKLHGSILFGNIVIDDPKYYKYVAIMKTEAVQSQEGDYDWNEIAVAPGLRNWKYTIYTNGT